MSKTTLHQIEKRRRPCNFLIIDFFCNVRGLHIWRSDDGCIGRFIVRFLYYCEYTLFSLKKDQNFFTPQMLSEEFFEVISFSCKRPFVLLYHKFLLNIILFFYWVVYAISSDVTITLLNKKILETLIVLGLTQFSVSPEI